VRRWTLVYRKVSAYRSKAETPDHVRAVSVGGGPSVEAVRDSVESVVGEYSQNEYFEVELESSPTPA
jgi:hypothetical protein